MVTKNRTGHIAKPLYLQKSLKWNTYSYVDRIGLKAKHELIFR
jgi:hypothetical protein